MSNCPRFCKFWWWTHVKKVFTENPVLKVCPSKAVLHLLLPRTLGITSPGHPYLLKYYLRREAKFAATKCVSWHEDYIRLIIFKKQKTGEVSLLNPFSSSNCLKESGYRAGSRKSTYCQSYLQRTWVRSGGGTQVLDTKVLCVSHCLCTAQQAPLTKCLFSHVKCKRPSKICMQIPFLSLWSPKLLPLFSSFQKAQKPQLPNFSLSLMFLMEPLACM